MSKNHTKQSATKNKESLTTLKDVLKSTVPRIYIIHRSKGQIWINITHKIKHGLMECTTNLIHINEVHNYHIRNDAEVAYQRSELAPNSAIYDASRLYHKLPYAVKSITNISAFKLALKHFIYTCSPQTRLPQT